MHHIGVDLGARKSQVCICTPDAAVVLERKLPTSDLCSWFGSQREKYGDARIVLESCAQARFVAMSLIALGFDVCILPATYSKECGVGRRRRKTDRHDARSLAQASCRNDLPRVHVASDQSEYAKSLCPARDALVRCRTLLINSVRGYARKSLLRIPTGRVTTFSKRVRTRMLSLPEGIPTFIESLLKTIDAATAELRELEKKIVGLVNNDPVCRLLMTAPVGPLTAIRYRAQVDDVKRFHSAKSVSSYFGLTVGEDSSGEREHRTSISKAGNTAVRHLLIQSSWAAWRTRPEDPLVRWAKEIAKRRGVKIAVVAIARKLAGILFAMWRGDKPYDPLYEQRRVPQAKKATVA